MCVCATRERDRDRETETETDRQRERDKRERDRDKERETERERRASWPSPSEIITRRIATHSQSLKCPTSCVCTETSPRPRHSLGLYVVLVSQFIATDCVHVYIYIYMHAPATSTFAVLLPCQFATGPNRLDSLSSFDCMHAHNLC